MSVKAKVACGNDGVITLCKIDCDLPISELYWWFFTSIINHFDSIKLYEEIGIVGRNQEGVGLVIDIKTFEFVTSCLTG